MWWLFRLNTDLRIQKFVEYIYRKNMDQIHSKIMNTMLFGEENKSITKGDVIRLTENGLTAECPNCDSPLEVKEVPFPGGLIPVIFSDCHYCSNRDR